MKHHAYYDLKSVCVDCALKAGFTYKKKCMGVWSATCDVCGKKKATVDLCHDMNPPKKTIKSAKVLKASKAVVGATTSDAVIGIEADRENWKRQALEENAALDVARFDVEQYRKAIGEVRKVVRDMRAFDGHDSFGTMMNVFAGNLEAAISSCK